MFWGLFENFWNPYFTVISEVFRQKKQNQEKLKFYFAPFWNRGLFQNILCNPPSYYSNFWTQTLNDNLNNTATTNTKENKKN